MKNKVHAVGIIFENNKGDILVLRRHEQDPEGGTWGLVGGKIDEGENKIQTAVREIKEEINYLADPTKLQHIKTYHWDRDDMDLTFEVFKLPVMGNEIFVDLDKNENTEYLWSDPKVLYHQKNLMKGLYPILKDFFDVS